MLTLVFTFIHYCYVLIKCWNDSYLGVKTDCIGIWADWVFIRLISLRDVANDKSSVWLVYLIVGFGIWVFLMPGIFTFSCLPSTTSIFTSILIISNNQLIVILIYCECTPIFINFTSNPIFIDFTCIMVFIKFTCIIVFIFIDFRSDPILLTLYLL